MGKHTTKPPRYKIIVSRCQGRIAILMIWAASIEGDGTDVTNGTGAIYFDREARDIETSEVISPGHLSAGLTCDIISPARSLTGREIRRKMNAIHITPRHSIIKSAKLGPFTGLYGIAHAKHKKRYQRYLKPPSSISG